MNIALWIVQGLTALAFFFVGFGKLARSRIALKEGGMAWVDDFSDGQIKLIGLAEILGALGLILPAVLGIWPILTPIAGIGLAINMAGAAFTHVRRGETNMLPVNTVLFLLAVFVAVGRFFIVPIV